METKLLKTTVVGSYSLPKWLEIVRDLHKQGKITDDELEEAHDNAVKSCIKDQELAGVDVITDGELRRETMVYFFTKRIYGFKNDGKMKPIGNLDPSIQMPDPIVFDKVKRIGSIGVAKHWKFLKEHTYKETKVTITGPQMLAKRSTNEYYKDEKELIKDLAEILREEIIEVVSAGCKLIQIDEPVWVGYPEDLPWLIEIFNQMIDGIDAKFCLHICYGNYQLKRLFKGQYADLFPALLDVNSHQLSLEFAVNNAEPLELFKKYGTRDKEIVVGVIDVKDPNVETPEMVAQRIRRVFDVIPPEKVWLSPDCGMKFMPRNRAFAKLCAMTQGAEIVRSEISN